jgi:GntR family transcriptional regulator
MDLQRRAPANRRAGQPHTAHQHGVRRLRDALRSQVLHGDFPGGLLPSEAELMAGHGATRGVVREALALLRRERLIERTQGVGTYAVRSTTHAQLTEMHGAGQSGSLLEAGIRPRILDRSVIEATPTVAKRLGVESGTPCLRYEYVALIGDEPIGPATNYVLFPEASRLLDTPFNTHGYQLLDAAGIQMGASEFVMGCVLADAATAELAGVPEGSALLLVEQLIRDADGRPWDLAFFYVRADRFVFVSRSLFDGARVLPLTVDLVPLPVLTCLRSRAVPRAGVFAPPRTDWKESP